MSEHVRLFALEAHSFLRLEGRSLRYERNRVLAGIPVVVVRHQLGEMLDVGRILGDEAAVGCAGHRRQQRREAGISAEDLDDEKALVGPGRGAQPVRELDRARDAGTEADAVIAAVHVVVHRLRDGDDVYPFIVQAFAVAERVVASDRDQYVDSDVLEVQEHVLRDVVDRLVVAGEMRRHARAWQVAWPRSRGVEESAARAAGAIHDGLRELLHAFGVVGAVVPVVVDESRPTAPNADNAVTFAQRADRDRPDRRIETGDVAAAGENRDCWLVPRHGSKAIGEAGRSSDSSYRCASQPTEMQWKRHA